MQLSTGEHISDQSLGNLLSNNNRPASTDYKMLKARRTTLLSTISNISPHMFTIERILHDIKEAIFEAEQEEQRLQAVLHPVRAIPNEILSRIFEFCVPGVTDPREPIPSHTLSPQHPPWTLSQVSRRWRLVALSYAKLWSSLCLNGRMFEPGQEVHRANLSLQRSGNRKIGVSLTMYNTQLDGREAMVHSVRAHASRIRTLHLDGDGLLLHHMSDAQLGSLHSLEITMAPASVPFRNRVTFLNCPELRMYNQYGHYDVFAPWRQITQCCLRLCNFEPVRQLERVETLALIATHTYSFGDTPISPRICLSNLHSLELSQDRQHRADTPLAVAFWESFQTPTLRSLKIILNKMRLLSAPLPRFPVLTDLSFVAYGLDVSQNVLYLMLREMQYVKRLSLDVDCATMSLILPLLVGSDDMQPVLPCLRTLRIGKAVIGDSCIEGLLTVVRSRVDVLASIEVFENGMFFKLKVKGAAEKGMKQLEEANPHLRVSLVDDFDEERWGLLTLVA